MQAFKPDNVNVFNWFSFKRANLKHFLQNSRCRLYTGQAINSVLISDFLLCFLTSVPSSKCKI